MSLMRRRAGKASSPIWLPLIVMVTFSTFVRLAAASEYNVGGEKGWRTDVNYADWAAQHTFHEGDIIVFSYPVGEHDVLRVSPEDYDSCRVSTPMETDASGETSFSLRQGGNYFICGFPKHCAMSQKVFVDVDPFNASSIVEPSGEAPALLPFTSTPSAEAPAPGPSGDFAQGRAAPSLTPFSLYSLLVILFLLRCLGGATL